jgi:hypothetical protein
MSEPDIEEPADLSLHPDNGPKVEDEVNTDIHASITTEQVNSEWGASSDGLTIPSSPGMAMVGILRGWTRAEGPDIAAVAAALTSTSPTIDQFLAEGAEAQEFGRSLFSGEVYGLGAATDEGRAIPKTRWLALAKTAPGAFVWHVPPPYVLPFDNDKDARAFAAELLPWVERADLRVTLNWLGSPGFLADDDAVDRISDLVRAQAAIVGWGQSVDAMEAMVRRGGRWRAARTLERLLRELRPDREEAAIIQRVARTCMDAQLFARIACEAPWKTDDAMLADLADRISTASLVQGFFEDDVARRAHLRGEAANRVLRTAWRALSGRRDPDALIASSRLVMRESRASRNPALCREMVAAIQEVHGDAAVEPLTAVFLAGVHRSDVGPHLQRFLMARPEAALTAALGELPNWMPGFDASAMERLSYRCVERLDEQGRARIRDLAEMIDGVAAQRVLRELDDA